ncbi:MAG TPA: thioredoxin-like domain-containing protein, partial [Nevskiaceae bacterium]|nr:thioredoxin-like domain-containing protein [Nevskiaceae bacterium]
MPRSWVQNLCLFIVAVACVLAGLLFARPAPADPLPVAPPIPAGLQWYNVSRPLTLKELRGRAVLLDFFSPGCINCIHMLPLEAQLEKRFGPRLVVIGVDSPKFSSSSSPAAVESFIARHHLTHPMVLDHHSQLWNRYGVNAWPTLVLIGPRGRVVDGFIGDDY